MKDELFIIVTKESNQYNDIQMITRNTAKEVIAYVGNISSANVVDLDVTVERIFSVSHRGKVTHYSVEFTKGKFCLEAQPEVR